MLTKAFWIGLVDRAVKSFAQALVLFWGADAGLNILTIDFKTALGLGAGYALLSVLTSLASAPSGDPGTTSFLPGGN